MHLCPIISFPFLLLLITLYFLVLTLIDCYLTELHPVVSPIYIIPSDPRASSTSKLGWIKAFDLLGWLLGSVLGTVPFFISPPMFSPTVSSAVCSCLLRALLYNLPFKILLLGGVLMTGQFSLSLPLSHSGVSLKDSCHSLTSSQTFPAEAWFWTSQEKFPEDWEAEMRTAAETANTSHEQQPVDPPCDLSQPLSAALHFSVPGRYDL